jgi:hypothetical protein
MRTKNYLFICSVRFNGSFHNSNSDKQERLFCIQVAELFHSFLVEILFQSERMRQINRRRRLKVSLYRYNCTIHKTIQSQLGETLSIAQASKAGSVILRSKKKLLHWKRRLNLNPTRQAIKNAKYLFSPFRCDTSIMLSFVTVPLKISLTICWFFNLINFIKIQNPWS